LAYLGSDLNKQDEDEENEQVVDDADRSYDDVDDLQRHVVDVRKMSVCVTMVIVTMVIFVLLRVRRVPDGRVLHRC